MCVWIRASTWFEADKQINRWYIVGSCLKIYLNIKKEKINTVNKIKKFLPTKNWFVFLFLEGLIYQNQYLSNYN